MRAFLSNLLRTNAQNVNDNVLLALLGCWVMILLITFSSIISQRMGVWAKLAWILLVTFIPILGLAVYLAYCITKANFDFVQRLGLGQPVRK